MNAVTFVSVAQTGFRFMFGIAVKIDRPQAAGAVVLIKTDGVVRMRVSRNMFLRSTVLFALAACASVPAFAGMSNKWRLQFSGAAESAGEMVFEIVPAGRTPVRVTVAIEGNDGENRVARKVKTAIDRQAGKWVDAELDDGEDVLVKRHFFRRFSITLISNTVKDVRVNFDTE